MNAKELSLQLQNYGDLPIQLLGWGDITQVSKLDRLNQETLELEDAVIIFGSEMPGDAEAEDYGKLQTVIDQIEEWQADDDQVTGIDLLLQIKATLTDIVSLGDTEEVE